MPSICPSLLTDAANIGNILILSKLFFFCSEVFGKTTPCIWHDCYSECALKSKYNHKLFRFLFFLFDASFWFIIAASRASKDDLDTSRGTCNLPLTQSFLFMSFFLAVISAMQFAVNISQISHCPYNFLY